MAISFNKREVEKKKRSKRIEKQKRKEQRKAGGGESLDDMIAYVDENGRISSTPPDMSKKKELDIEDIVVSIPKQVETEKVPLSGLIDYFNGDKGFGFIKENDNQEKYFFHISGIAEPELVEEGKKVTFNLERGLKGMTAVDVQFIEKPIINQIELEKDEHLCIEPEL
jgi:cold shock CspA family protein